ncbi:MAG TPA: NAD(P)-dependent oxidoreductase [Nitrospiraceae bacterium]|nr:NAD(P)-dependent oxidoreductase [Nitrospiraceae bacterium]
MTTVGLLGTGLMGRAIAERLHAVHHSVIVYNRTAARALSLQNLGVTVVTLPEQAVVQTDVVLLVLADAAAIQAVLLTPAVTKVLGGKTIVQMGTIAPDESKAIQREVERFGGTYCEAPILGSLVEAKSGTLQVMVGGTDELFSRWFPLFRSLSREPRLIGPVGTAAALKLALNQLIAAEISAFALSLALIQRAGVPVDTFMTILRESALFAPSFEKKLPRLLKRDYHNPNFSTRHLLKDVELFLAEAIKQRLTVTSLEGIVPILQKTIDHGLGEVDYSAIYDVIHPPR